MTADVTCSKGSKTFLNLYMFDFQKGNDCILVFEEKLQYSDLALNIFFYKCLTSIIQKLRKNLRKKSSVQKKIL